MKKKKIWYKKLTFSFLAATVVLATPTYSAAEGMKDFVAQKDNGKGKGHNDDDNNEDESEEPEEDDEDDEEDDGNGKGKDKDKNKVNKGAEIQLERIGERLDDIEERITEATAKLDSILGGQTTPTEEDPSNEEEPPAEGEEPPVEEDPATEEPVEQETPATEEVSAQNTESESDEEPAEESEEVDSDNEEQSEEDADEDEEEELDEEEKFESANGVRGKLISSINQLSAVEKQISNLESKVNNAEAITALNERVASLKTQAEEQLTRIETAKPEEIKKEKKTKVYVEDVEVEFDQEPIIIAGRTVVPLRAIFEALGAEIEWDNKTQTVTATKDDVTITLKIGAKTAKKNGTSVNLDQAAIIKNGRTMVPVRFIGESFDTEVVWDQETQGIYIIE
ncbi:copper amine oxidase N-terminal domain-containing protein [Fictibacillus nanhaiensis]|uniref:copper amine oxidase N-terminal domain-containing protein n=1 Tax=Fictibacillus nanhaiensis TaxID=742169 RepID=UPI00204070F6|nr:copper amine oxidase N-terminal domain-containing protein [Fictibacillus nanhaiensis]MCM3733440.1 copper amine oxidase N-terminal domain-containing protein [Fictibacillus nanhaiensis]